MRRVTGRFDISHLARLDGKTSEDRKLAVAARQFLDARSVWLDLQEARRKMTLFSQVAQPEAPVTGRMSQANDQGSLGGSLFAHALILYCRATSHNDGRGRVPIVDRWSTVEKSAHKRLVKELRNETIAHFGHAQHHADGPWADDQLLFLQRADGTFSLSVFGWRMNYRQNSVFELVECIERADLTLAEISKARSDRLGELLVMWRASEPQRFATSISAVLFDDDTPWDIDTGQIANGELVTTVEPPQQRRTS